jgi:hypothetical protein
VIEVVKKHGRLKVLDDVELVVEFEGQGGFDALARDLEATFGGEADLELLGRKAD